MNKLTHLFKQIRLAQVLTAFLVGVLVLTSTACNNGDVRGARPENPPVQMGGNNNPHTMGGDGYTNFKASTDAKVNQTKSQPRAELPLVAPQLIAARLEDDDSDLLYPGGGATTFQGRSASESGDRPRTLEKQSEQRPKQQQTTFDTRTKDQSGSKSVDIGPSKDRNLVREATEFPKQAQRSLDRSDPNAQLLERVGEQFKDASEFITDKANEAINRPEMQPNPALEK